MFDPATERRRDIRIECPPDICLCGLFRGRRGRSFTPKAYFLLLQRARYQIFMSGYRPPRPKGRFVKLKTEKKRISESENLNMCQNR